MHEPDSPGIASRPADGGEELSLIAVLLMVACVALTGIGASQHDGTFSEAAVGYIVAAMIVAGVGMMLRRASESAFIKPWLILALAAAVAVNATCGPLATAFDPSPQWRLWRAAAIVAGALLAPWRRDVAIVLVLTAAGIVGARAIIRMPHSVVDAWQIQQGGCFALQHGADPYTLRFQSGYTDAADASYYGPGLVRDGWLLFGYCYPPLALLLSLPGYLLLGDVRYSMLAAILLSAWMMATARQGVLGFAAALMALYVQTSTFLLVSGWNDSLSLLCFSLTMWCACRWRRGLPWALGLFLASKQYSILLLPLVVLLPPSGRRREWIGIMCKAIALAIVLTAPMALWHFPAFWRSAVRLQFMQPFRRDAISLTAYLVNDWHWPAPPNLLPLAVLVPALGLPLWRGVRSPAGFAAAAAWTLLAFLLFSKQAFANYYFLAGGVGCWTIAALDPRVLRSSPRPARRRLEVPAANPNR